MSIEIKKDIFWVGVKNPELRVFDIIMTTEKGTTYNSYLVIDEKIALIDTVKDGYFDEFIGKIKEIIGDRKIDYVVVNHTEPDHSGSLELILDEYPEAVVVGSKSALINIKNIINKDFTGVEAKQDISLGKKTLKFISAPFLHWPDTIYTYVPEEKIIFTCDCFGCHFCDDGLFNDEVGDFSHEMRYYYDVIMGPFKKHVLSAIDKIKDLEIEIVAPSHGPIHRENPHQFIELYEKLSREGLEGCDEKYALVLYVSAYGYTRTLANAIGDGMKENGTRVEVIDISEVKADEIILKIEKAKAIAVGSSTINQDVVKPVWDLLSYVSPITNRGKVAAAFGSYGWSGEAIPLLTDRLKGLKFKVIEPGLKVIFKPTEDDIQKARELGREIANKI